MITRMVVPLDGSTASESVLPYARLLAGKLKTPVELMGVVDVAELVSHVSAERARVLDRLIEEGVRKSETYLKGVAGTFAADSVVCSITKGRAAEAIIEKAAAETSTLIAIATHGRSGFNRWLLGSVAEKVLRGTNNPVLLVRAANGAAAPHEARLESVIVPLDGSELAETVIPIVVDLAKKLDVGIVLFRAFHLHYGVYAGAEGSYGIDFDQLIEDLRQDAGAYLEKHREAIRSQGVDKISCVVQEGLSSDEIISFGRRSPDNLIAMCTHGRSGVQRWVLGSVTETVVRHSGNPVLVLRAT
jgi:nucleotide-binding universal stress UspA family protein